MKHSEAMDIYGRLVRRGLLAEDRLRELERRSAGGGRALEDLLVAEGVPKHEVLLSMAERYHVPFEEFDESVMASYYLVNRLDRRRLLQGPWFPLSVRDRRAEVIVSRPDDHRLIDEIKSALDVDRIDLRVAVPVDIVRIIEHNFDVNPRFSDAAGRTPLARVRTFLAGQRSAYAHYRTLYAKARTGLAFIRTGVSFIVIGLLFLRVLGGGWYLALEVPLLIAGVVMVTDGVKWYLPARGIAGRKVTAARTDPTWGTSVLQADATDGHPVFSRTGIVAGAAELRNNWSDLSPVMRRRFLASDRTDMAEERTSLAGHRTMLARARTGLAFARTGIAFAGLGIGLFRQFTASRWTVLDAALMITGALMTAEGFHWYFGGRKSGLEGFRSVRAMFAKETIWDLVFPSGHQRLRPGGGRPAPPVREGQRPGIWATTGLALERTVLADRRGVMARLRTVMAIARTGMAYIRTGMSIASVGAGLLVYFGSSSVVWTVLDGLLIVGGLALVADGFRWSVPAERMRKEYPYCFGDMEITVPDYGRPARTWGTVIFNHHAE
jgi:uncharacterized membrane protein YidH (DUF202 family)